MMARSESEAVAVKIAAPLTSLAAAAAAWQSEPSVAKVTLDVPLRKARPAPLLARSMLTAVLVPVKM